MNKDEAKKIYRKLCIELHPDKPNGSAKDFIIMKNQYEALLRGTFKYTTESAKAESNALYEFINANEFMKGFDGVTVELTGSWIWLCGNTYKYKEEIKKYGFKYSKSKKKWYKAPEGSVMKKKRRGTNFTKITHIYGYQSQTITGLTSIA